MCTCSNQVKVQVCNEPIQCTIIGVMVLIRVRVCTQSTCAPGSSNTTLCVFAHLLPCTFCASVHQTLLSLMLSFQQQYQSNQQYSQQLLVTLYALILVHLYVYTCVLIIIIRYPQLPWQKHESLNYKRIHTLDNIHIYHLRMYA